MKYAYELRCPAFDINALVNRIIIGIASPDLGYQLTLKGALLFDSGSAKLKENVYPMLDKLGLILMTYPDSLIEIEGHTDNVPIHNSVYANNDELSSARALSVFQYFMDTTTLDPANIKHSGRGEYVPVADNSTEEGRAHNRRVEIRIYNTLSTER